MHIRVRRVSIIHFYLLCKKKIGDTLRPRGTWTYSLPTAVPLAAAAAAAVAAEAAVVAVANACCS